MESGEIRDQQIKASSFAPLSQAFKGRLNNNETWSAATKYLSDLWIQVNLQTRTSVSGIITQGNPSNTQRITKLQIQYGKSEPNLMYIMEQNGDPKVSMLACF